MCVYVFFVAFQMKKDAPEPEWGMVPVYVYIAVAVIIMLMLSLCVWGVLKVWVNAHTMHKHWDVQWN